MIKGHSEPVSSQLFFVYFIGREQRPDNIVLSKESIAKRIEATIYIGLNKTFKNAGKCNLTIGFVIPKRSVEVEENMFKFCTQGRLEIQIL